MNKTSSKLTNFTCFVLLLFLELLNPGRDETPLSNTPAGKDICSGFVEDSFCNGRVC